MKISRSTYYHRPKRAAQQLKSDMELREVIEKIHLEFPGYGYRRVHEHLLREGIRVNSKRIRRIMKRFELFSCVKKWLKPRGGALGKKLVYPNLLYGKLLCGPNQVWATDITFIKLPRELDARISISINKSYRKNVRRLRRV